MLEADLIVERLDDEGFVKINFKDLKINDVFRMFWPSGESYLIRNRWLFYATSNAYLVDGGEFSVGFLPYDENKENIFQRCLQIIKNIL